MVDYVNFHGKWAVVYSDGSCMGNGWEEAKAESNDIPYLKIITDSKYIIGIFTEWVHTWKRNGWINARGHPVANQGLIQDILQSMNQVDVRFSHVYGHRNSYGNNRADKFAKRGAEGNYYYVHDADVDEYYYQNM